jgi:hypothetical protein
MRGDDWLMQTIVIKISNDFGDIDIGIILAENSLIYFSDIGKFGHIQPAISEINLRVADSAMLRMQPS